MLGHQHPSGPMQEEGPSLSLSPAVTSAAPCTCTQAPWAPKLPLAQAESTDLLTLKHSYWPPLGQSYVFLSDWVPPRTEWSLSSQTGFPLEHGLTSSHRLRTSSTPRQGCVYSSDWIPPGQSCVHPSDCAPHRTRLYSPLRLVTTFPLDEPPRQSCAFPLN